MTRKLTVLTACLLACMALAGTPFAWAGADAADGHDDLDPNEGPPFWGFVKDERGVPVRDAKVTAAHSVLTLVTRTNATGAYKVRGFRKDVKPDEVVIACSKEGYKQVRVFRFPPPRGTPVKSVETECRLQRQ